MTLHYLLRPLQNGSKFDERTSKVPVAVTLVSTVGLFRGFALEVAGSL